MAPSPHGRSGRTLACIFLAALPLSLWLSTAGAEDRKFVVLLVDVPKDGALGGTLPNPADIRDNYFDKVKDAEPGQAGPRIDSFAEWWEEVSYGRITVSGNAFGWIQVPWPTRAEGNGSGNALVIPHVELQGNNVYTAGSGEFFSTGRTKFEFDWDGVGENLNYGNNGAFLLPGLGDVDELGNRVWAPGERFVDLNGNADYDAGVFEWGIDKNNNGVIDIDRRAGSFAELFGAVIQYPPEGAPEGTPILFDRWANQTEWFDSNGDNVWDQDGLWDDQSGNQQIYQIEGFPRVGGGTTVVNFYRGDWGGREIWINKDGNTEVGNRATQDERVRGQGNAQDDQPASIWEFLIQVNDPEDDETEYYDEQWNDNFDFPEPFEDFLRRWDSFEHQWVIVDDTYVANNYPGTASFILSRTGNARYDSPDFWSNDWDDTINSTNKLQHVLATNLADAAERVEAIARSQVLIPPPEIPYGGSPGWSLNEFWQERYGTPAPQWDPFVPYLRVFNPNEPRVRLPGFTDDDIRIRFEPDRGGPNHNGRRLDNGARYGHGDGTVRPNVADSDDGLYDAPAEYDDLPSSIYHQAGDGMFGEVTSPENDSLWGHDVGPHDPNSPPLPDQVIAPAGPLAFNVHGDGGWDGGNQMNVEFLTWRTDGTSNTDIDEEDFFGFITRRYHRDVNLDGLIDQGETRGRPGEFNAPPGSEGRSTLSNYCIDADPGTRPNGTSAEYPFNRTRALEDAVEALDDTVNWNEFLGGPGELGTLISGLMLLSDRTPIGTFEPPASGLRGGSHYEIRTRDRTTSNPGREHYEPLKFWAGLGISLAYGGGDDPFSDNGPYMLDWAEHEYGHMWEGWPDLYDYDVIEDDPDNIINNPIGAWCIMANGGSVHPVPILKMESGWIQPVDITTALAPLGRTSIELRSWEFDPNKTVFVYENPTYDGEEFWFWRNSPGTIAGANLTRQAFDVRQPGHGLVIMHVDRGGNPNGVPDQQRIGTHFTYQIVQADGLQELENGEDNGDSGDIWPGSTGSRIWNRNTDPNNRWYDSSGSGLDIVNIVENANSTIVTFGWTPREVPSFEWVQPPGGTSTNGIYTLRYFAYDQFGGTTISFFVDSNGTGYDGAATFPGQTGKPPGDVDGAFQVDIGDLPNGTYQFYAKLTPGPNEHRVSVPRPNINNQGNGALVINDVDVDIDVSKLEVWTARCINDAIRNREQWRVTGSVSGTQGNIAITGQLYESDPVQGQTPVKFSITGGANRFRVGDQFSFVTTGLTAYSAAILIFDGEVVTPLPPDAQIDTIEPPTGLAGWTEFTFTSASSDPGGADFTEVWSFGDGQTSTVQSSVPSTVTHTYATPGVFTVTLTATNSFGLSSVATAQVTVADPKTPTPRLSVSPLEGRSPLRVTLNGSASTDQNDPSLGGSDLTFRWTLNDGTVLDPVNGTPNSGNVVVTPGPASGPFDVTFHKAGVRLINMTVTNGFGKSAGAVAEVRVTGQSTDRPPVAVIAADKRSGGGPLVVNFNGNDSHDPEGSLLEYVWNFGDGTPLVRGVSSAQHTFTRADTYDVTLTVTDGSGLKDSATLSIVVTTDARSQNGAPIARILTGATQGPAPFTVEFDARSSTDPEGGPLSYAWDFGDGSAPVFGPVVSHTFTDARNYSVVLQVADSDGGMGATTVTISVTLGVGDSGRPTPDDGSDPGPTLQPPLCGSLLGTFQIALTAVGILAIRRRYTLR